MYKIIDSFDLKKLENFGFKYDKFINRYVLSKKENDNWSEIILTVDRNGMVKSGGTSIDYEKEIQFLKDINILEKLGD